MLETLISAGAQGQAGRAPTEGWPAPALLGHLLGISSGPFSCQLRGSVPVHCVLLDTESESKAVRTLRAALLAPPSWHPSWI